MPAYANRNGNSGVVSYLEGRDWLELTFRRGRRYLYTYASCGAGHVEAMRRLARAGLGLSTYVSQQRPQHA